MSVEIVIIVGIGNTKKWKKKKKNRKYHKEVSC